MATSPPTKEDRNANLDALQDAVDEWADKEKERLEDEVKYLRQVLKNRNQEGVVTINLATASNLLQQEVSDFIVFGDTNKV